VLEQEVFFSKADISPCFICYDAGAAFMLNDFINIPKEAEHTNEVCGPVRRNV
jgi:hypothetical protein